MSDVMELESESVDLEDGDAPDMARVAEQWKTRFNTLFLHKFNAVMEIAKTIKEFHEEYNETQRHWHAGWPIVCKQVVGVSHVTCSNYEKIHRVFTSAQLAGYEEIWPAASHSLYLIAMAFEAHDRTVYKALAAGEIHRDMSQENAKQLKALAEADAEVKGEDWLYGSNKKPKPKEAKPRNYRKYEKKAEPENADGSLDDPLSMASVKARITADAKIEESDKVRIAIAEDIEAYGKEIDPDVLSQILRAYSEYPRFFEIMYMWEGRFNSMAISMAMKALGYKD